MANSFVQVISLSGKIYLTNFSKRRTVPLLNHYAYEHNKTITYKGSQKRTKMLKGFEEVSFNFYIVDLNA